MTGYLDYNSSDIMTILIFGGMFFIFAYAVVGVIYFTGYNSIKQGHSTFSSLVVKAILLQLVSVLFVFVLIYLLELQGEKNNLKRIYFTEATTTFFLVDWANIDIKKLVDHINSEDIQEIERKAKMQGMGLFVFIKVLWSFLTPIFVFVPIVIVMLALSNILLKHKENKNGYLEIMTDMFSALAIMYFLFTVHLTIPQIILNNMYKLHQATINTKIGASPKVSNFSYRARAGHYILISLDKTIQAVKANSKP